VTERELQRVWEILNEAIRVNGFGIAVGEENGRMAAFVCVTPDRGKTIVPVARVLTPAESISIQVKNGCGRANCPACGGTSTDFDDNDDAEVDPDTISAAVDIAQSLGLRRPRRPRR
jgi:hypothetical protein